MMMIQYLKKTKSVNQHPDLVTLAALFVLISLNVIQSHVALSDLIYSIDCIIHVASQSVKDLNCDLF